MYRYLILVISLLAIVGCSDRYAGGRCEYEIILGVARLSDATGGEKKFRFYPTDPTSVHSKLASPEALEFSARQPADVVSSATSLPAQLSVNTVGSCTPYKFMLLSSEYFSHNVFISFDKYGRPGDAREKQFIALQRIYRTLNSDWPELSVELCETKQLAGVNGNDAPPPSHYAQIVKQKLLLYDFDPDRIHIIGGEKACGGSNRLSPHTSNGVNLRFILDGAVESGEREPAATNITGESRP